MSLATLGDLLARELMEIFAAEKMILNAWPKFATSVSSTALQTAIQDFAFSAQKHLERLREVFRLIRTPARGRKCMAVAGLIEQGNESLAKITAPALLEAAVIVTAQKINHYELAAYGALVTCTNELGMEEAAALLEQTLEEVKDADDALADLALQTYRAAADGKTGSKSSRLNQ